MDTDYQRIEAAIRFIARDARRQPSLEEIANELDLSPSHCQRLFRRWAGVSPKRFLQFLTVEHAKQLLRASTTVLDTTLQVGLSGPGRLHDHFVTLEAVTPGEYAGAGAGLEIQCGVRDSPFGPVFIARTERGVCAVSFVDDDGASARAELQSEWPAARLRNDDEPAHPIVHAVHALVGGTPPDRAVVAHVRGTNFQVQVWRALLEIPPGQVRSYEHIARAIGRPSAARAVGTAVGANSIAAVIPCHRVIRSVGEPGGYRWGPARKRAILARESSQLEPQAQAVAG